MKDNWILLVAAVVAGAGCSDSDAFGPESSLRYELSVAPAVAGPGSTVHIGISISLTSVGETARVQMRGYCAENVEVFRELVATLPDPARCPDSVYTADLDHALSVVARIYEWAIPADLASGTYTLRGLTLVEPSMEAEAALEVE
jgi:hypothetical protein